MAIAWKERGDWRKANVDDMLRLHAYAAVEMVDGSPAIVYRATVETSSGLSLYEESSLPTLEAAQAAAIAIARRLLTEALNELGEA